ncbi:MAG: carbohydrate binding domain-containing protein, partial [Patescibacteria group bacterium]
MSNASSAIAVNILSGSAGTSGTASLLMGNNDRVTQIDIGNVVADAARQINVGVGNSTAVDTFNIGTGATTVAGGKTIHIGDGTPTGSGTNLITIGTLTNDSTTTIRGGTGASAVSIQAANGATILMGTTTTANTSIGNATGTLILQGGASSTISLGGTTISATELNYLDGHDAALVDINDAVNTAIIGTGALTTGSIASGFGTIATANTITGTTLNGTTGINTGASAGTQRIDATGNLVNIGNVTTSGASTFTTTGANGFTFKPGTDNTSAFQIQNASSDQLFNVDTATTPNLITNPSFETNDTGWTVKGSSTKARTTAQKYSGNASLAIDTTTTNDGIKYAYSLASSTKYSFSFYAMAKTANFA